MDGAGIIMGISLSSTCFCSEPKTALKKKKRKVLMRKESASNLTIVHLMCCKINWKKKEKEGRKKRRKKERKGRREKRKKEKKEIKLGNMLDRNQYFLIMIVCQVLDFTELKERAFIFLSAGHDR